MKVLLLVHGYPPLASGGTELYAEAHARGLHRHHGDQIVVLTREQDPSREEYAVRTETRDGIRIIRVNNTFRRTRTFAETYANDAIAQIAEGVLDEVRPDVAHIHHLTCLSTTIVDALARRRIPAIMTLHDYWLICHRGQLLDGDFRVCDGPEPDGCGSCLGLAGRAGAVGFAGAAMVRTIERQLPARAAQGIRRAAETLAAATAGTADEHAIERLAHMRRICGRITHFLAPSAFMRDRFIRFGVPPDRITIARYGIDHEAFARTARPARQPGVLRLGFFGSLMISKAPHLLLEAAALVPAGSVTIDLYGAILPYHGDESYRTTLQPLLSRDGIRMHGPVSHERVADAIANVDVVVVPSIWPENSPFVIHEAFVAGVPVVASRIGGIPELVEDGRNGLLFEAGNAQSLSRMLARLVTEPQLLDSLRPSPQSIRTLADDVATARGFYQRPAQRAQLAAIVLNYLTPDDTWLAVKALLASNRPIDDIIVVNNARADTPGALHAAVGSLPAVTVLHTGGNLGFSGGMNRGIREALARGADRILLVNSDVIVPPDCIAHLEDALDGRVGVVGPAMLARTDPGRIVSLGIAYSNASGRMRHRGFGALFAETPLPQAQPVDAVSGCVMLVTRDVIDAAGQLDEDYFFSFEDVDFCLRARRAGYATVVAGRALVYHEGNRSIGRDTAARLYFGARNHLLLSRRADPESTAACALRAVPIVALNVAHAMRANGGSLPARLAAVVRGIRDYALGRFGAGAEARRLAP